MDQNKVIPIGCDHAGFERKQAILRYFDANKIAYKDYGCYSEESVDYPDFGHAVAKHVETNDENLGILLCGSGNGINMTANKHAGIRSALCWSPEIAELARQHNNANILAIPARFLSEEQVIDIVKKFLNTSFEGGRHAKRVDKISC